MHLVFDIENEASSRMEGLDGRQWNAMEWLEEG